MKHFNWEKLVKVNDQNPDLHDPIDIDYVVGAIEHITGFNING
jgi:hypothetical protein